MAMKLQHEVCPLADPLSDEDEPTLQHGASGPIFEDDLESKASTSSGSNTFKSEAGEDSEGDLSTSALLFSSSNTLVIFDWDDTLLPTTWLLRESLIPRQHYHPSLTVEQQGQLRALAESVEKTLSVAKEHGRVVIITNGEQGWVQYSCMQYLPALVPLLHDVKIVSARSTYESCGYSPDMWKCLAFQELISNVYGPHTCGKQPNVLSLGDSMHEHKALLCATKGIPNCRAKFLKFSERPDVGHLIEEHKLLGECLKWAIRHDDDLDLEIAEESSPSCGQCHCQ